LYGGGLFNVYDAIAKQPTLDAVLHLGDYIYEYGADGYGADIARKIGRIVEPSHEILTLTDYRQRHAQVKRDANMQAAHARAAFICVWDDHEVANDDWIGGAENHDPAKEGDWKARKAAAMQAYFEWMPIRDPLPGRPWEAINRSFEFGDLATLAMVETGRVEGGGGRRRRLPADDGGAGGAEPRTARRGAAALAGGRAGGVGEGGQAVAGARQPGGDGEGRRAGYRAAIGRRALRRDDGEAAAGVA
jgi:phosphodiesterase/alkaline phosphatase D-like protein